MVKIDHWKPSTAYWIRENTPDLHLCPAPTWLPRTSDIIFIFASETRTFESGHSIVFEKTISSLAVVPVRGDPTSAPIHTFLYIPITQLLYSAIVFEHHCGLSRVSGLTTERKCWRRTHCRYVLQGLSQPPQGDFLSFTNAYWAVISYVCVEAVFHARMRSSRCPSSPVFGEGEICGSGADIRQARVGWKSMLRNEKSVDSSFVK